MWFTEINQTPGKDPGTPSKEKANIPATFDKKKPTGP
jgi:hypothetical protein